MTLTHHDLYALAGYATAKLQRVLKEYDDIIYIAAAEITMTTEPAGHGYSNHLTMSAHYQRNEPNNVAAIVARLIDRDNPEHREMEHMPLQRAVRSRAEIDEAIADLRNSIAIVRGMIDDLDNAIREADYDDITALDRDQI